jgi:anthranilate synthase/aminodeoxychorismate synthase-like glutamine amidotransferase
LKRLFLLDNYDSFTWNLVQYFRIAGAALDVGLNDETDVGEILAAGYDGIVISPGPGRPSGAGVTLELIRAAAGRIPVLGVCLGLQAMARAWGGRIVRAPVPVHGKTSLIHHDGHGLFRGIDSPFAATRYHSLVVEPDSLPDRFQVGATTDDGVIMAIRDPEAGLEGVQFHPESILTREGMKILENFLGQCTRKLSETREVGCCGPA